jgi:hypothetical protein
MSKLEGSSRNPKKRENPALPNQSREYSMGCSIDQSLARSNRAAPMETLTLLMDRPAERRGCALVKIVRTRKATRGNPEATAVRRKLKSTGPVEFMSQPYHLKTS